MKAKESQLLFERVTKLNDEQKSLISDIIQIVDLEYSCMLCLFEEHDEFQIIVEHCGVMGYLVNCTHRMVGLEKFSEQDIK